MREPRSGAFGCGRDDATLGALSPDGTFHTIITQHTMLYHICSIILYYLVLYNILS